jgi:dihydroneopterin aldolase
MNQINIEGIRVYAYHGCIDEEAKVGGYFTIDVEVIGDFSKAIETDDLKYAFDYVTVSRMVTIEMQHRCNLIEKAAQNIVDAIKRHYIHAKSVKVKVTKHRAPIELDVEQVSVIVQG